MKTAIKRLLGATGRLPGVHGLVRQPGLRSLLEKLPGTGALYENGWNRRHPFDRDHGTDTSGFVSADELPEQATARGHAVFYAGSQPSVLRRALGELPPLYDYTFVDLGCGKGRPLLVASEFPFRAIMGVELAAPLAEIARRNAAIVAARFPARTRVQVTVGDASQAPLPAGNLVVFMYHPFAAELVAQVVTGVEHALSTEPRKVYVVYYNPVAGHCFDASPRFTRRFAGMIPYAREEQGFGPDEEDAVVIWQSEASEPTHPSAHAEIDTSGLRAVLKIA